MFRETLSLLVQVVLPRRCHFCGRFMGRAGKEEGFVCGACRGGLVRPRPPVCRVCAEPLAEGGGLDLCRECRARRPDFVAAGWVAAHDGPLAAAVRRFKYRGEVALAHSLGPLLAGFFPRDGFPEAFDLILPVPLHPGRLKSRGFNQAALLAGFLEERGEIRLDLLRRLRPTAPQVNLNPRERAANVKDAFGLSREGEVQDRTVLLVDDVYTTGATMRECAAVLVRAGARAVHALTLGRALKA